MMKKIVWCLPFLLMLLLVLRHGEQANRQKNQIPSLSLRAIGWLMGRDIESSTLRSTTVDDGIPSGPNLSTCNISVSRPIQWGGHYINCCPSRPDSEQPIIDFEFPSQSSPIRLRRPAHRVADDDEDYLAKYKKAVTIMKQLPPDHPHSWKRQANIHCLYCTGSYYRANHGNDTTPFNIHGTWLFFPFHRYYVYFHERIIGKLIGDDTFALPYWSWDSPDGMPIPSVYLEGLLHHERNVSHLPPKVADLSYISSEGDLEPEDQIATNLALMYNHMVSGATKPELFMGSKLRSCQEEQCYGGSGTIETAPHNTLHLWVGEDMSTFYAAARDPVFYAHHANIDRMWHLWRKGHGYRGSEPEFDDPEWLDSFFYFYDENLNLVRVKVRDSIDMDKLRYAYEEVDIPPWLDARPKPSVPPKIARNILRTGKNDNVLMMPSNKGPWTLEKTVRVRVTRPTRRRTSTEEEEVLNVHGISIDTDMYVKFDVYINVVDETMASPRSREYAGCFVKMKGGAAMKGKQNVKLGISEILKDLEADEDESIWVSLVPRAGTGNMTTTVDRISIEYIE